MNPQNDLTLLLQAKAIFELAVEMAEEKRQPFIEKRCGGNLELKKKCESLLKHYVSDSNFYNALEVNIEYNATKKDHEFVGKQIGAYKIIQTIGCGGMGDVFTAKRIDGIHDDKVALKLIRGWGNTEELVSRFNQERKILAELKHPNIARLMDGGSTEDGRPWYVMEYIDGQHIDNYCRDQQLTPTQMLDLFLKVCAAVESAHKNLIIHRDLKPGNILVTHDGEPKLLDFGIAKLLNEEADNPDLSVFGFPMTPGYASPEQRTRRNLTTASDQYSLGVILYELLTGELPFQYVGNGQISLEHFSEPLPPSKRLRELAKTTQGTGKTSRTFNPGGDIDSIVLKALQPLPEHRYHSVQDFYDDIKRYLRGQPVEARKATYFYKTSRFIKRNKIGVSASLLAFFVIVIITASQQLRIIKERDIAIGQRNRSENIQEFIIQMFNISNHGILKNDEVKVKYLIDRSADQIEVYFKDDIAAKIDSYFTLGKIYYEIGLLGKAIELLSKSRNLLGTSHPKNDTLEVEIDIAIVDTLLAQGNYSAALDKVTIALNNYLSSHNPVNYRLGEIYNRMARSYAGNDKLDDALLMVNHVLPLLLNESRSEQIVLAETYSILSDIWYRKFDFTSNLEYENKALELYLQLYGEKNRKVSRSYSGLGRTYLYTGNYVMAESYIQKALQINLNILGDSHPIIADNYNSLGATLGYTGRYQEAVEYFEKSQEILLRIMQESSPEKVAENYRNIGKTYYFLGQYDNAEKNYLKGLALDMNTLSENHIVIAYNYINLGSNYTAKGEYQKAAPYLVKAKEILLSTHGKKNPIYAMYLAYQGELQFKLGEYFRAENSCLESIKIIESLLDENATIDKVLPLVILAKIRHIQENYGDASLYLNEVLLIQTNALGESHTETKETLKLMAELNVTTI